MTGPDLEPFEGFRLAMVLGQDGATRGPDGTSKTLSNPNDRDLLMTLRRQADVVITDAVTATAEKYRASKLVPIEIWSRTGKWPAIFNEGEPGLYPISRVKSASVENEVLRLKGKRVLVEAGRTLTSKLAPHIGQLVLTVPRSVPEPLIACNALAMAIGVGTLDNSMWITSVHQDDDNFYLVANRRGSN
ncbi:MAG: hypothetical protein ACKOWJ_06640 [Micrococcales bacterium]